MGIVKRIITGLVRRIRVQHLRWQGVRIDAHCWIQRIEIPRNHREIHVGASTAIDRDVVLLVSGDPHGEPKIVLGRSCYLNRFSMIDAAGLIQIGDHCMIGPYCYITDHDHAAAGDGPIASRPLTTKPVRIESNVWIGAHCCILKGVTIGTGAIVGAGSVVTRNVPPGATVVGVPAKSIGQSRPPGERPA